ncbi:transcriptional regulator of RNA polII, SAGA, subunit-domain-containing protein [Rhodofomes roseus]|uniref:Transcriptional regulator of RNA polII, SAGA, subunit-domain-containing protein n=1 Tax=Rhodofomes roseus TaxID=34475 RepID=A0ABQ8KPM0_9APHY|nr:transcriptional regulator of RNA polII, SAGA, subunit-domain-containing protein [Rhodofomes roseus]KAH9839856.1 transcriptional regulator of RNA polII, SAGA, subunit-domain-containing protein [Rhodofomes roseus]
MSLPSTTTTRHQLVSALGSKAPQYWNVLREYLTARISRTEFDEQVKALLETTPLLQLHNSLIVSLFDTSAHLAPPTPPPDLPKLPARKRRRTLPYQGADSNDTGTLRSDRLKRWTVGMGRRERERVRQFKHLAVPLESRPQPFKDEIAAERGVQLLPERGEPAGSRLPLQLASISRGFTLQHISDRMNLVCAQNNLGAPSRAVSQLMMLGFEAKLKQIISQALSLTSTSHAITSIQTSGKKTSSFVLPVSAFETLFTVSPAVLPNQSAAAMRMALGDNDAAEEELPLRDRETHDQRWQMLSLLSERSTLKEALRTLR